MREVVRRGRGLEIAQCAIAGEDLSGSGCPRRASGKPSASACRKWARQRQNGGHAHTLAHSHIHQREANAFFFASSIVDRRCVVVVYVCRRYMLYVSYNRCWSLVVGGDCGWSRVASRVVSFNCLVACGVACVVFGPALTTRQLSEGDSVFLYLCCISCTCNFQPRASSELRQAIQICSAHNRIAHS